MKFVAADMPEANEMVVGIMALVAQAERRMISERTKAALQAAKAQGREARSPDGRPRGRGHAGDPRPWRAATQANAEPLPSGCVRCSRACRAISQRPGPELERAASRPPAVGSGRQAR